MITAKNRPGNKMLVARPGLYQQLKQRKVFRVTSMYAVLAWGAVLGAAELFPSFSLAAWYTLGFALLALALLPVIALLTWLYELTSSGLRRDPADLPIEHTLQLTATVAAGQRGTVDVLWRGELQRFSEDFSIGRDPRCEVHTDDPQVSRRHCKVTFKQGRWHLLDLGSRNGSKVNGEAISEIELHHACRLELYAGGLPLTLFVDS
ncbi:MAG: FHA domain-containing protein [Pseudomonadales bacterium]